MAQTEAFHGGRKPPAQDHELTTSSGEATGMRWEIRNRPSYASLRVDLSGGAIRAESGAMVSMTDGVDTETKMFGGLSAVVRKLLGGESLFLTRYHGTGQVTLAPTLVGDIVHFPMDRTIMSQAGAYLAASPEVETGVRFAGLRGIFGGEGAFFLRHQGRGDLFLTAYGAIEEMEVTDRYVVDTGHLVAWDESLEFSVKGAGGLKSLFFSGEGLVLEFRGRGSVWIQTRTLDAFVRSLIPYLPR